MDPNATLAELRELIGQWEHGTWGEARTDRAMGLAHALDEWLSGGGYLPADWQPDRSAALAQARSRYPANRRDALFPTTRRPIF